MKLINYIGMAMAVAALASCSNDEMEGAMQNASAVKINATVGALYSRSNPVGTEEEQKAFRSGDRLKVTTAGQTATVYTKQEDGSWQSDKPLGWTKESMTFEACYPEEATMEGYLLPIDQTKAAEGNALAKIAKADYMTCTTTQDKAEKLNLAMQRQTARVVVNVTFGMDMSGVNIEDVEEFVIRANRQAGAGEAQIADFMPYREGKRYVALLAPTAAQMEETFMKITVNQNGQSKTLPVKGIRALEKGKNHEFNLTVGKNGVEMGNVTITDWTEGDIMNNVEPQAEQPIVDATNHSIRVQTPGTLTKEHVQAALADGTKSLSVAGYLDGPDLRTIREATGCPYTVIDGTTSERLFTNLDMTDASIMASNKRYAAYMYTGLKEEYYTEEDNIFAQSLFMSTGLDSITLPKNLYRIGYLAFYRSGSLKRVTMTNVKKLSNSCFSECGNLSTVNWGESAPDTIAEEVFYQCWNLKNITIPSSVTTISSRAFFEAGLECVEFPQSVTSIGYQAFAGTNLQSVVIPATVTKLEEGIFYNCKNIQQIRIECNKATTKFGGATQPGEKGVDILQIANSENCDLVLHSSFASDVTTNENDQKMFEGKVYKSINFIGDVLPPVVRLAQQSCEVAAGGANALTCGVTVENATEAQPQASANVEWIKNIEVSALAGGKATMTFNVDANNESATREGIVTVTYEGAQDATYTVRQQGKAVPVIVLTNNGVELTKNAESNLQFAFRVENPVEGVTPSVECTSQWIKGVAMGNYANGNGTVNYAVDANNSSQMREGSITVKYEGAQNKIFTIRQQGTAETTKIHSATFNNTGVLVGIPAQKYAGVTYEALVNFSQFNNNNTVIGQEEVFLLRVGDSGKDNNQVHVCFDNLNDKGEAINKKGSLVSDIRLEANKWYHLAATIQPSGSGVEVTLYINGVKENSQVFADIPMPVVGGDGKALSTDTYHDPASANFNAKRGIFIGRLVEYKWGERPMNGMMREARVWSVARTADQIKNNMFSVDAGSEGLEAYYKFDGSDVSDTTVTDASGKNHNGTVKGGTVTTTEHESIVL